MPKLEQSKTTIASQEKNYEFVSFREFVFVPSIVSSILVEPPLQGGTTPLNQLSLTKRLGHGSQPALQAPARTTWPKCSLLALGDVHLFFCQKIKSFPSPKANGWNLKMMMFWKKTISFSTVPFSTSILVFGGFSQNGWRPKMIRLTEEILHKAIDSLFHYLEGFIYPRWCRISSINSIFHQI